MKFYNPGNYNITQKHAGNGLAALPLPGDHHYTCTQSFVPHMDVKGPRETILVISWLCIVTCDGKNIFDFSFSGNFFISEAHIEPTNEELDALIKLTHDRFRESFNKKRNDEFQVFEEMKCLDGLEIENYRSRLWQELGPVLH